MRLDYLKIGSTKDSPTHQFKNLKDVCIDFDQKEWITVVIGWNGTGKSNVREALAVILRSNNSPKITARASRTLTSCLSRSSSPRMRPWS